MIEASPTLREIILEQLMAYEHNTNMITLIRDVSVWNGSIHYSEIQRTILDMIDSGHIVLEKDLTIHGR